MSDTEDVIFEGPLADSFSRDIYGTTKGDVRLHVLWHDLRAQVPAVSGGRLRVLDVGAGLGQLSGRLAALGHVVTLCEPSTDMIEQARRSIGDSGLAVRLVQSAAQDLRRAVSGQFDLVLCHAVLEWLADPRATLKDVASFVRPAGYLSLMFYNQNAAILSRVLRGEFARALGEVSAADVDTHQPAPLNPARVRSWLTRSGLRVQSKAGIRIFHDYLPEAGRTGAKLEELLHVETELRSREPFASLGQHIHFVCRWK